MQNRVAGSLHLLTAKGIDVYVHWTWLIAGVILFYISDHQDPLWFAMMYVSLFLIVLLHEFGHALACRSVGGRADLIVLWPLGGIAFVQPPERPGAVLWSIAAGPLVNVVLVPFTLLACYAVGLFHTEDAYTALQRFVFMVTAINLVLLVFNMMPVYPLDGGQILQSILWFFMGRAKSLRISAGIGLACAVAFGVFALSVGDYWFVILAIFIGIQAWTGLGYARVLAAREHQDRMRLDDIDPWREQ